MGAILADQIARSGLSLRPVARSVLVHCAFYADNEGRGIFVGAERIADETCFGLRTVERAFAELRRAGWLCDDGLRGHVRRRRIPVERLDEHRLSDGVGGDKTASLTVVHRRSGGRKTASLTPEAVRGISQRSSQGSRAGARRPTTAVPIDQLSDAELVQEERRLKVAYMRDKEAQKARDEDAFAFLDKPGDPSF